MYPNNGTGQNVTMTKGTLTNGTNCPVLFVIGTFYPGTFCLVTLTLTLTSDYRSRCIIEISIINTLSRGDIMPLSLPMAEIFQIIEFDLDLDL